MNTPPRHLLSYGQHRGPTLRWLTDPSSRDFDLSDLVVVTATTRDEFGSNGACHTLRPSWLSCGEEL